jgi:hypothetical protein
MRAEYLKQAFGVMDQRTINYYGHVVIDELIIKLRGHAGGNAQPDQAECEEIASPHVKISNE